MKKCKRQAVVYKRCRQMGMAPPYAALFAVSYIALRDAALKYRWLHWMLETEAKDDDLPML